MTWSNDRATVSQPQILPDCGILSCCRRKSFSMRKYANTGKLTRVDACLLTWICHHSKIKNSRSTQPDSSNTSELQMRMHSQLFQLHLTSIHILLSFIIRKKDLLIEKMGTKRTTLQILLPFGLCTEPRSKHPTTSSSATVSPLCRNLVKHLSLKRRYEVEKASSAPVRHPMHNGSLHQTMRKSLRQLVIDDTG